MLIVPYGILIGFMLAILGFFRNLHSLRLLASGVSADDLGQTTVIIAARNEEQVIEKTVRGLLERAPAEARLIVVDDNSTDSTWEILQKLSSEFPCLLALRNNGRSGKAGALNVALDNLQGDFVVFLDADAHVDWSFIRQYIAVFSNPSVNAIFSDFEPYNSSRTPSVIFQDLFFGFIKTFVYSGIFAKTVFMNSGFFIRRGVLDTLGKFDPETTVDDFDLGLRLKKEGMDIKFILGNKCRIQYAFTIGDLFRQYCRWFTGGIRKLLPERKPLSGVSLMVIIIVALIGFFPHIALVTGFATGIPLIGAKIAGAYVVVLASASVFGYIFHEKRPRREVLFNLFVGTVSMYFIFQAVIFVSFFRALGKKDDWYKVSRKAD